MSAIDHIEARTPFPREHRTLGWHPARELPHVRKDFRHAVERAWLTAVHFSDIKQKDWPYKNFRPSEFACKGTGLRIMTDEAQASRGALQQFRTYTERPVALRSSCRTPRHNKAEGGGKASQHLLGVAHDIALHPDEDPKVLETILREFGFTGIGRYAKRLFIHVDTRKRPTTWGKWS